MAPTARGGRSASSSWLRRRPLPTHSLRLALLCLTCAVLLLRPTAAQSLALDAESRKGCVAFQHEGRAAITNQRPDCADSRCAGCAERHAYQQADMPACKARASNAGGYDVQPRAFALVMDRASYLCEAGAMSTPYGSASRSVAWRPTFDASRCCWQRAASAPPCSRAFSALVSLGADSPGWLLHHRDGWLWVAPDFQRQGAPQDYCWRLPNNATAASASAVPAATAAPAPPPALDPPPRRGPAIKLVCNPPASTCPAVYGPGDFAPCKVAVGPDLQPGDECWAPEARCPPGYTSIACSCISHGGSLAVASTSLNGGGCTCLYVNPTTRVFRPGDIELLGMSIATCALADDML